MLRPVPIAHYLATLRAQGYRDKELLIDTRIEVDRLNDPDYLIRGEDQQAFLSNVFRVSGNPGVGLDLGLGLDVAHFGMLGYTGLSARTIRAGLEDVWARYGRSFGTGGVPKIVSDDDRVTLVELVAPRTSEEVYRFAVEESLTVLLNIGRAVTGETPPFTAVMLSFPRPTYGHRYQQIFQCPVQFDAPRTCVAIQRGWVDRGLLTFDAELLRVGCEHLDRVRWRTEAADSVTQRLRELMRGKVDNIPTLDEAAQEFGVSSRTLARMLEREGANYRLLTEELRRELAQTWLGMRSMNVKEIGHRLGFQDVGAFRRAFRDWTGQSVTEYLAAIGAAGARVRSPGRAVTPLRRLAAAGGGGGVSSSARP